VPKVANKIRDAYVVDFSAKNVTGYALNICEEERKSNDRGKKGVVQKAFFPYGEKTPLPSASILGKSHEIQNSLATKKQQIVFW
jgi:hypothetical protein